MSTISLAEAGPPSSSQSPVTAQDMPMARHVAFVPRSALDDAAQSSHASQTFTSDSLFDLRESHGYNPEVSSHGQSTLLTGFTESGEVNGLVAHFDSSTDGSTTTDISQSRYLLAPVHDAHSTPGNSVRTVQVLTQEQTGTDNDDEKKHHSPRKPIPAQWFPKCNGPNLATAQRAKERSQKKSLHNNSPVEVKTIRGTRSSLDIGHKNTTPEAASFLTKEALAAVDNDITASTSPPSQNKAKRSPTKPTRNSPNVSPMRSSPRQHAFTSRISPSKTTFLSTASALAPHSSISHSATTSVSGASFYTAEASPVRSYANSELSFQSATESFEDDGILYHDVNADSEKVQAVQSHKEIQTSLSITTVEGKRSPTRPKLTLTIPDTDLTNANENSASPLTACSNSSATSVRARNMSAATQSSRIPRATTVTRSESARGPTRSSISKRVQPVESPNSKDKPDAHHNQVSTRSNPFKSNTGSIPLSGSTVDSSVQTDLHIFDKPSDTSEQEPGKGRNLMDALFASAATALKTSKALQDPVSMDSAVIYSRKKTNITYLPDSIKSLPVSHSITSGAPASTPQDKKQLGSDHGCILSVTQNPPESKQPKVSASGSDLRATAAEFVPQASPPKQCNSLSEGMSTSDPALQPNVANMAELDQYNIPWFYYLYPIQFAYEQGFRNGRSKSPRKFRPKKQRSLISLSNDAQSSPQNTRVLKTTSRRENEPPYSVSEHGAPATLSTHSRVPKDHIQIDGTRSTPQPSLLVEPEQANALSIDAYNTPFSSQLEIINQQATLNDCTNQQTPRFSNVDLTTIRNVHSSHIPHKSHRPNYYTFSRRGQRQGYRYTDNGLYGSRGPTGVPIYATMPFPDPVPPPSRPDLGQTQEEFLNEYTGYSIGVESCGIVDIGVAAEKGGNLACNACAPDH